MRRVLAGPPKVFTPSSGGVGMIADGWRHKEETMTLRILSGGAIAALAGAAMLAAASGPSDAFTLNSPSLEAPAAAAGIEPVYWRHWGWHRGWGWRGGWHRWGWGPGWGYGPRWGWDYGGGWHCWWTPWG